MVLNYPDPKVTKVLKKSKPFNLGFCACGCGTEISIFSKRKKKLRRFVNHHNTKGEFNPAWKGGGYTDSQGYEYVYVPDHPYRDVNNCMRKHRLIMEEHLGRYLTKKEVVHHLDGNPFNNDISNLKLYSSNSEHLKDNHTTKEMSYRYCLICGSNTTRNRSDGSNRPFWLRYKDGYKCISCNNKYLWQVKKAKRLGLV